MNHKLWIDGAEMSVFATTRNGEMTASCWGQTSATARPLPTRDQIAGELSGWPIGNGYYATIVSIDEARDMADAVLALLKGKDA